VRTLRDRDTVGVSMFSTNIFYKLIPASTQAMNPFRTGKLVLFQVTYNRDWHFFEIMFFVVLGIFGVLPCVAFLFPSN
jgi:H+/Cl- antiporter ClcA